MRQLVVDLIMRHRGLLLAVIGLALSDTSVNIAAAWSTKRAVDSAMAGSVRLVLVFAIMYIVLYIAKYTISYAAAVVSGTIAQRITFLSQLGLLRKFSGTQLASLHNYGAADNLSKICNEVPSLLSSMTMEMCGLATNFILVIGAFVYLFRINGLLTIICFLFGPLIVLSMRSLSPPIRRLSVRLQQSSRHVGSYIQTIVDGIIGVKAYGIEVPLVSQLRRLLLQRKREYMMYVIGNGLGNSLLQCLGYSPLVAVLGMGGWLVAQRQITAGDLMAFISLFDVFVNPIIRMSSQGLDLQKHLDQFREAQAGLEGWRFYEPVSR